VLTGNARDKIQLLFTMAANGAGNSLLAPSAPPQDAPPSRIGFPRPKFGSGPSSPACLRLPLRRRFYS